MPNRALQTLYIFNGIFVFAAALLGPLYAIFAESINLSIISISASISVLLISAVTFTLIIRSLGDRIQEKEYLLLGGFVVRAVAWFGFLFVTSLPTLLIIQVLLGLGEALGSPAFNTIFATHLDKGHQIEEFANWHIIAAITAAAGVFIGGLIVSNFGFAPLFVTMGSLAVVSFMGVALKPRKLL